MVFQYKVNKGIYYSLFGTKQNNDTRNIRTITTKLSLTFYDPQSSQVMTWEFVDLNISLNNVSQY